MERTNVKSTDVPSIAIRSKRGSRAGERLSTSLIAPAARPRPAAPPSTASSRLSTSISRARRPRPAPMAARTASSWARPSVRTSIRLATLAQAISRTIPIVAMSTQRVLPKSPTRSSISGRAFGAEPRVLQHLQAHALRRRELAEGDADHPGDVGVQRVEGDAGTQPADAPGSCSRRGGPWRGRCAPAPRDRAAHPCARSSAAGRR